ncbi:MAG: lysylphosphatidylglycerol synthase transmembrane domain-containing protein [bacterium]
MILSAAALAWSMPWGDLPGVWTSLKAGRWEWLALALPLYLLGYWSRARRVAQLLEPIKPAATGRILPPLVIGFLFNNILPGRLGELVFAHLLGRREGISRTASFAVVVLSRVLDGITIIAFFLFGLFAFLRVDGSAGGVGTELAGHVFSRQDLIGKVYFAGIAGAILFGLVSAACFLLIAWQDLAMRLLDRLLVLLPQRLSSKGRQVLEKFIAGMEVLRNPRLLLSVFLFNFVPWGLELFTYYFGARVFGLALTVRECALVMGMTNLAMLVPSMPGGIGPFEVGGMIVMGLLGVAKAQGFAYILTVHLLILLPINIWGAWFLWREGISFQDALRSGEDPGPKRGYA